MHGYSWLPGILTSWNLASSHFCQNSGNSGMINPEAFVMFQFLSIYLPSDPSWMSKSGPENLLFLEMGETGKGLSLSCHSHVQLPGCSVWIVSQGFVKSNSPTCPLDLVHSLLWPSESHTKIYLFGLNSSFPLAYRLPSVISPSPGTHPESTSYWPLSFPPSCFTHSLPPDSPTIKESNPINRHTRVLITDNHLMYYPSQRNYPHLICKAFIERNEFF